MGDDVSHPLLVDLYEVMMAVAYRHEHMAERRSTFSLFVRSLPPERGYLVAAGLDDVLRWLERFRFGDSDLAALDRLGFFADDDLAWLGTLGFEGNVRAVPEGTIVFGEEPIVEVEAPLAVAQLAETFLLNQVTVQTVLASKAARCRHAAAGRAVVDFALRRTQGIDAGMKLARVCRLVGLAGTSNIAAADRYRMAASGTMAHSYVQAHADETEAFRAFARSFGERTVLLVDTYDSHRGIERAVRVAIELRERGVAISGIRLDSGDLAALAHEARRRLDAAGLPGVRILASGGLDEHVVHRLLEVERAPIDGFGIGSALGVSADAPNLDSAYKLVACDGRPVRKTSEGKATWPGAKQVWRQHDWSGDVLALTDEPSPVAGAEALLVDVMCDGRRTEAGRASLDEAHDHFEAQWQRLPDPLKHLTEFRAHPVRPSTRLVETARRLDADQAGA